MAEALGVAGSIVGVVSLGIQVAQGLLDYYESWKDQDKEIYNMCISLEDLLGALVTLRTTIESFDESDMTVREMVEKNIRTTERGINELSIELQNVLCLEIPKKDLMRRRIRKALYPFKQPTLSKLEQVISQARSNLGISLQTLQLKSTLEVRQNIDKLVRWHEDYQSQKMLDWISWKNFRLVQNDVYGQKQPETGQWLLDHPSFLAWEEGKVDTPLWCVGSPGVGKTVLSSAVVKFLEQDLATQKVGVAFIYCDHKSNDDQRHDYFICAIIRQLIEGKQMIPEDLQTLYDNQLRTQSRPSSDEYLSLLQALSKEYSEVYVLIDGLDECINKDREMIWNELLIDLKKHVNNLRLLCTSRDMDVTETALSESTCIQIRASDGDMKLYIQGQVQSSLALAALCRRDTVLENEVLETVVAKAEGMFLAAKLHINSLASQKNARAVRKALHILPKDIDGMYDQTMERILLHRQKDLALQTLMWIAYAPRLLSIEEVQHAVAIDDLEPEDTLITEDILTPPDVIAGVCAGLIKIYKERGVIGLVHKTTQEYFDRKFAAYFPDAIVQLGISYYRYLSLLYAPLFERKSIYTVMDSYKLVRYVANQVMDHDTLYGEIDRRLIDLAAEVLMDPEKSPLIFRVFFHVWGRGSWVDQYWGSNPLEGFLGTHCAALMGWDNLVKHLMEDPTLDIDSKDCKGQTPLWYAALNGRERIVKMLLESGRVDINSRNYLGTTPLWHAADRAWEAAVKVLLANDKVDVNLTDDQMRAPLWPACLKGHIGIVELLLEKGVDNIDLTSESDGTALTSAACNGREAIIKLLIEKGGADVNGPSGCGATALMWAAWHGHDVTVRLLLEKGADTNVRNRRGETALMWAAWKNREVILKLLLEKGVTDIDAIGRRSGTEDAGTALMWAAYLGNEAILRLLLEEGADVNVRAKNGVTALMWAASKPLRASEAMVKLLLENGIDDINAEAEDGTTALSRATSRGWNAIVKLLLENGVADVNADDEDSDTASSEDTEDVDTEASEDTKDCDTASSEATQSGEGHSSRES